MKYKIIVDKQSRINPTLDKKEYEIDIEELRYKNNIYDSINIEKDSAYVTRKLSLSKYNVLTVLENPIIERLDLSIELFEGDNYIYLIDMIGNKFYAEYLIKNDFTEMYATKNEMHSAINETAQSIELTVNQKLKGYSTTEEMNSTINISSKNITETVSKTYASKEELATEKAERVMSSNEITQTISKKVGNNEIISKINQSAEAVGISADKIELSAKDVLNLLSGNTINLSGKKIKISSNNFNVDENGNMSCVNANMSGTITSNNAIITGGKIKVAGNGSASDLLRVSDSSNSSVFSYIQPIGAGFIGESGRIDIMAEGSRSYTSSIEVAGSSSRTNITALGITTPTISQTSLSEQKKNFERLQNNALDIIKNTDIYKYHLKSEKDTDKKHIGFVIGKDYKHSSEITAVDEKGEEIGVDTYSMISVAYKAIQELAEQNEKLTNKIETLEKGGTK